MSVDGGAVLPAVTESRKVVLEAKLPSLTVSVMSAYPLGPARGVRVTVRLLPLPPKTMWLVGNSVGRDELADTVRFDAAVSGSPTTNGSGANPEIGRAHV